MVDISKAATKGFFMPQLSREQVEEKVTTVLLDILKVQKSEIHPESNIRGDLGADSMDIVTLLMALEESLDIQISDEDAKTLVTVEDTIAYISAKTGA